MTVEPRRAPPLLAVEGLTRIYDGRRVVDDVSFAIAAGETVGLVGESGSGKTTTARMILRLEPPSSGGVTLAGEDFLALRGRALKAARRQIQPVFQDPYGALDPRLSAAALIGEPLVVHRIGSRRDRVDRVAELMRQVGLDPGFGDRLPHQFSGGQRQRIGIARALALDPRLIVADEPVTALDVSIQAQIVNLFHDLRETRGVGFLFISHDLAMVRHLCDRVAVMLRGRIVEMGPAAAIFEAPAHPYTKALLSAVPIPDPDRERARRAAPFVPDPDMAIRAPVREMIAPDHWRLA